MYGYYSNVNVGTNKYNFYAGGSAPNYFGGKLSVVGQVESQRSSNNPDQLTRLICDNRGNRIFSGTDNVTTKPLLIENGSPGQPVEIWTRYSTSGDTQKRFIVGHNGVITIDNLKGKGAGYVKVNNDGALSFSNSRTIADDVLFDDRADARQITNTEEINNATATVQQLQPVKINGTRHGFTASELEPLFAEAVSGTAGATEPIGTLTDWDGTELETEVIEPSAEELTYTEEVETDGVAQMITRTRSWTQTGTRDLLQGVDQTKLIPLLTKALQEVMQKNEDLEARIAALEGA